MELERIQSPVRKDIMMSVRTTKEMSQWMKDNNVSPTRLFNAAVKELREKK